MSAVIFFQNIPHIVRYGSISEKKGTSSMHFYRSGIHFDIDTSEADVKDTLFAVKWRPLIDESGALDATRPKKMFEQWNELCTCVIAQCLPLLEALAPTGHEWETLHDHFYTPTYNLKLSKSSTSDDACAVVNSGPTMKPSFEHLPVALGGLDFNIPEDIPHFSSADLIVLDQEKDYRTPPYKITTKWPGSNTNSICYFRPLEKSRTFVRTGITDNPSQSATRMHLRLHELNLHNSSGSLRIPKVLGIVSDRGPISETSATLETRQSQLNRPEVKFAGLLHTLLHHAVRLSILSGLEKPMRENLQYTPLPGTGPKAVQIARPSGAQVIKWQAQVRETLGILHGQDLVAGTVSEWSIVIWPTKTTGGTVGVDDDADAWLTKVSGVDLMDRSTVQKHLLEGETEKAKLERGKRMDLEALEATFKRVREKLGII